MLNIIAETIVSMEMNVFELCGWRPIQNGLSSKKPESVNKVKIEIIMLGMLSLQTLSQPWSAFPFRYRQANPSVSFW